MLDILSTANLVFPSLNLSLLILPVYNICLLLQFPQRILVFGQDAYNLLQNILALQGPAHEQRDVAAALGSLVSLITEQKEMPGIHCSQVPSQFESQNPARL